MMQVKWRGCYHHLAFSLSQLCLLLCYEALFRVNLFTIKFISVTELHSFTDFPNFIVNEFASRES